jgi:uncharacterized protein
MRALLDANIFISYLLYPTAATPPAIIARAGLVGRYTLLVSEPVAGEIRRKVAAKRWLANRIPAENLETFLSVLTRVAEVVPDLAGPYPEVGNDRKDDYLFAHALLGRADFLVSGDDGVVRIGQIEGVLIVSPAQFLAILQRSDLV